MRVLLVSGYRAGAFGGIGRETAELGAGLCAGGCEVGLLANASPAPLAGVRRFPLDVPIRDSARTQLAEAVRAFAPDVVHLVGAGAKLVRIAGDALTTVPWLLTVHCVPPSEQHCGCWFGHNRLHYGMRNLRSVPSSMAWRWLMRRGRFAAVICHSEVVVSQLRHAGCAAGKIRLIPFGCRPGPKAASTGGAGLFEGDDCPRIVSVGGMSHTKGFHDYLKVVGGLLGRYPRVRYCIVGAARYGDYERYLRRQVSRLGLEGHVVIAVDAEESARTASCRAADLYVQPSHEEGFCLSFMEAALMCPRLLGTRTGAMPEVASVDPAIRLVTPGDVAGLAEASASLLAQDVPVDWKQRRSVALAQRFATSGYQAAHLRVYADAASAAERRSGPPAGLSSGIDRTPSAGVATPRVRA